MENQIKDYKETIDQFTIIKVLGIGYTAQQDFIIFRVKLGRNPQGEFVAIKKYKLQQSALQIMRNQLQIMKQLQHDNILRIISVRENASHKISPGNDQVCFAVVLQYAQEGELFDYILETGKLSEYAARKYFKQLINGLVYIHEKGYSHRDLKLQNLLLSGQYVLKIADFGFSCSLKGHDGFGLLKTRVGTEGYMAPQIQVFNNPYDGKKIDIFSAGVILFIIHAGNPPFLKATSIDPHYKLIKLKKFAQFWKIQSYKRPPGFFTQQFKDLIQKMLAFQQNQRISIEQILDHAWIKGLASTNQQIVKQFGDRKEKLLKRRQAKKKKSAEQKKRRDSNIHSQGYNTRDNETIQDKQFLAIYNKQQLNPLKLQQSQTYSQEDILIKQTDLIYTVAQLKYYLIKHRVALYQEQQSQKIITQEPQEWICYSTNTIQNKIQIKYRLNRQLDNQNIASQLIINVNLGLKEGSVLLQFQRISGSQFYYRKVVNDIRNECLA